MALNFNSANGLNSISAPIASRRTTDSTGLNFEAAARQLQAEGKAPSILSPIEDAFSLLKWFSQGIQNLPNDTPLTEKLYQAGEPWVPNPVSGGMMHLPRPVFNVMARLAPAAAGLAGMGLAGPIGGGLASAGMGEGLAALGGLAAEGAIGGAAFGATQATVEQEPVLPNTVGGAITGAVLGAGLGKLSGAGRRLADEYATRVGPPLTLGEIADSTPDLARKRFQLLKSAAASKSFRSLVPEGGTKESVGEVLWERAREQARASVRQILDYEIDPTPLSNLMDNLWQRSLRPSRYDRLGASLDSFRKFWGSWVTRAGVTLRRDALSFPDNVGHEAAAAFERIFDLTWAYEGQLVERASQLLKGVPKQELQSGLFNFLTHSAPTQLSTEGTAAAQGWRTLSDNMFNELDSRGVRELVPPEHQVGQSELFPDVAEQSRLASVVDPERSGWRLVPIQYRQNYVPFYRDPKAISALRRSGPARDEYINKLLDAGQAGTRDEAETLLNGMLDDSGRGIPFEIRGGVAQHARELMLGLPTITDARYWMRRAIHEHARRAAEAEVLGGQDQLLKQWADRLKVNNGDIGRFQGFVRLALNRPWPEQVKYSPLVRGAGDIMNIMYLGPRVGALQFMQLSNTAARLGWRSLMEAMVATARQPELRQMVREAGVTLPSFHLQSGEIDAMDKIGRWWMEWITQMPRLDRAVRAVSGIAGGIEAQRLAARLATSGVTEELATKLGFLGLDAEQLVQQGSKLGREDVLTAMRNASMKTQFGSTALDMPMQWKTDAGKLVFKLRTFAKQQTNFVNDMVNDAMRGNVAPLTRYLITYPTIYFAMRPYIDFLSSRPAVDDADAEVMERITNVLHAAAWSGMFGGLGDFINNVAASDAGRLLSIPLGAAVSTAATTGFNIGQATVGNPRPLVRQALRLPIALPYHWYLKGKEWLENQP